MKNCVKMIQDEIATRYGMTRTTVYINIADTSMELGTVSMAEAIHYELESVETYKVYFHVTHTLTRVLGIKDIIRIPV